MPRKLRTFTTSAGFFDLAVAAPSMKAALEAWGSRRNLFHHGFAQLNEEPEIVAATMAKPGVVLRRPVGTNAAFSEHPDLPKHLGGSGRPVSAKRAASSRKPAARPIDERAAREAARSFEKEQKRRERQARGEEAARDKQRRRKDRAVAAAAAALEKARRVHEQRLNEITTARAVLGRKEEIEEARWKQERDKLETALREARSSS